jgi:hypothetical protein
LVLFFGFLLMLAMRWQLAYPERAIPVVGSFALGVGGRWWGGTGQPGGVDAAGFV